MMQICDMKQFIRATSCYIKVTPYCGTFYELKLLMESDDGLSLQFVFSVRGKTPTSI